MTGPGRRAAGSALANVRCVGCRRRSTLSVWPCAAFDSAAITIASAQFSTYVSGSRAHAPVRIQTRPALNAQPRGEQVVLPPDHAGAQDDAVPIVAWRRARGPAAPAPASCGRTRRGRTRLPRAGESLVEHREVRAASGSRRRRTELTSTMRRTPASVIAASRFSVATTVPAYCAYMSPLLAAARCSTHRRRARPRQALAATAGRPAQFHPIASMPLEPGHVGVGAHGPRARGARGAAPRPPRTVPEIRWLQ